MVIKILVLRFGFVKQSVLTITQISPQSPINQNDERHLTKMEDTKQCGEDIVFT